MQAEEVKQGRTFVLRLEDGDIVHQCIEDFARENGVQAAALIILGGADSGSRLVVGPEDGDQRPITTLQHVLEAVHEIAGTGTIFPNQQGEPVLHMHMACGRNSETRTGCIRSGVQVWQIMEAVLFELSDSRGQRAADPELGFQVLQLPQ
ncbi:PPC domain-containing DNA-binding protein [Desulfovermiculus halophilus]|jgi:predicted DNA-binding protein with PD1-like motif|uniref:PPC domain-containing DNA-binding protein n=1 Tax=Desulfovermiculus halophilus TaxID=339722 RepID=UPI00047FECA3|nr:PPC domain-containing DNA-binding protein [Desulfovermiculus halophilus]